VSALKELRELRGAARGIFGEALAAVDARRAVLDAVEYDGTTLRVGDESFEPGEGALRVYSVALGKAAAAMAAALDARLGRAMVGGVLSAPPSDFGLSERWRIYAGGHPLPNEESLEAARSAFELLRAADDAGALVVFLVSGGGSAMLELPRDERLTLDDLREANRVLVSCGAPIDEVNAVRRVLSAVKGGGLVARLTRAKHVTLVISDVATGRAYDVASGPTLSPPPDSPDIAEIISRYELASKFPTPILRALEEAGRRGTARTSSAARGTFHVLLDNESACEAAARSARERGFAVEYARDLAEQHVEAGAAELVSRLLTLRAREGAEGVCLISGGEFSCPVRGGGTGGRSSETALRVAFELEKVLARRGPGSELTPRHAVALCAGTDGIDGNSPAAGALADETTVTRAHAQGLDARKFLDESDAYTLFDDLGDAVYTGPTGTNVRDVRVLLAV
jgi:glycerate 2-kinase